MLPPSSGLKNEISKKTAKRSVERQPSVLEEHVACEHQLTFKGLHGVTTQKTEFFITTNVRISNLTSTISVCINTVLNIQNKHMIIIKCL
jgi:hypothetical protein